MKNQTTFLAALTAVLFLMSTLGEAAEPVQLAADLLPPQPIMVAKEPLVVDGFAAPCYTDFDGDGVRDLLVGQRQGGRMRIYRNVATNTQPEFTSFEWFQAGGSIANVSNCCRTSFTPRMADLDGDGNQDVLTGSGNGCLYVFHGRPDHTFAAAHVLVDREGETLFVARERHNKVHRYPYNSAVFPFDWDDDGDWDLIIGTAYGLSRNLGTGQHPEFEITQPLSIAGEPQSFGLPPCLADWDGDGLSDWIAGTPSQIHWRRNIGQRGAPQFGPEEILIADHHASFATVHFHAVDAADFNADGQLDLIVGGSTYIRDSAREPQTAKQQEAFETARAAYGEVQRRDLPDDASPTQQTAYHRELLDKWQRYESARTDNAHHVGQVCVYLRTQ